MTEKKGVFNNVEEIKGKFKSLLGEIKSLDKEDLKDLGKEYYADIKEALHVEEMKNSFNNSCNELEDTIRNRPLRSAAVCVGIGFILAKVCGIWKNG